MVYPLVNAEKEKPTNQVSSQEPSQDFSKSINSLLEHIIYLNNENNDTF